MVLKYSFMLQATDDYRRRDAESIGKRPYLGQSQLSQFTVVRLWNKSARGEPIGLVLAHQVVGTSVLPVARGINE